MLTNGQLAALLFASPFLVLSVLALGAETYRIWLAEKPARAPFPRGARVHAPIGVSRILSHGRGRIG